ncbi:MAG: hypothetical protein WCO66_02160 [Candidatus Absconditabacteria bacterium]
MIIKNLIRKHISEEHIEHIIFHSGKIVFRETVFTIGFLGILYGIFLIANTYIHQPMLQWIFGGVGIVIFGKYAYDFFNKYADCIVLSKDGVTFFTRDGFYSYKTEFFDWGKIESISHSQNNFRDKVFGSGELTISLDHGVEYPFDDTSNIKSQTKKLITAKENFIKKNEKPEEEPMGNEHIEILTEALSEVIKEYMNKKHR